MAKIAQQRRIFSLLNTPLPQALFVAFMAFLKFTDLVRGIDLLRLRYGIGITIVFVAMFALTRRRGLYFPAWVTWSLFAYVAFALIMPATPFYYYIPGLNRFEHFAGFAVLTLFVLICTYMLRRVVPAGSLLVALFVLVWSVGLANEVIEYFLYRRRRVFLNEDTLLDLCMNTAAIALVLLLLPRLLQRRD